MSQRARLFEGDGLALGPGPDFPRFSLEALAGADQTTPEQMVISLGTHVGGVIARHVEAGPPDVIRTIARRFGESIYPPLSAEHLEIFAAGAVNASLIRNADVRMQDEFAR